MALPKIDVPTFEVDLISQKKKVKLRPFLVKEQKILLMANESDDPDEILGIIKQVISNCVLDDTDIEDLPIFDLEYLLLNLRAKSVQEIVQLKYKCNNTVKTEEGTEKLCGNIINYDIDINSIKPVINDKHSNKIALTSKMGVVMKYPTLKMMGSYENMEENELAFQIIQDCMEMIYDEDNVYYMKDHTKEEIQDFIESLQQKDLEKFKSFYETLPYIKHDINFKCNKCGYEENIEVRGIENFFG